ncbi:MAG: hypothetical protein J2P18_16530 [Nocardia sp.]|nr:hypothetical protein [Nocardia sp.]
MSSLDLCGPGFTLLVAGIATAWQRAAAAVRDTGTAITVHELPAGAWCAATELPEGGALLVRSDQHVAARSGSGLTPENLSSVLCAITGTRVREDMSTRGASA